MFQSVPGRSSSIAFRVNPGVTKSLCIAMNCWQERVIIAPSGAELGLLKRRLFLRPKCAAFTDDIYLCPRFLGWYGDKLSESPPSLSEILSAYRWG